MAKRPEYPIEMTFNEIKISRVIIDQHYRLNHSDTMSDEIILQLVQALSGRKFLPESVNGEFQYFKIEPVYREMKPFRVILALCVGEDYLGVINAFRVKGEKK